MGMFFLMVRKPTKKTPLDDEGMDRVGHAPRGQDVVQQARVSARVGLPA